MNLFGYLAAGMIGLSLGLIGGGGSVLTVPVMVYLFGVQPLLATSYSLFVVGSTSLVGAVGNYRKGYVNVKTALLFGIASITTVFLTRKFIIPDIPKRIPFGTVFLSSGMLTMILFALLMLVASLSMIKKSSSDSAQVRHIPVNLAQLMVYGVCIGIVTGLLGAGGGFMLIPTLVLLVGLPMKEAIGTSLLIIALNSLIGFMGDLGHFRMDWLLLLRVTVIAVAGILAGGLLSKRIPGDKLKKGFGWFVLGMGIYIISREVWIK